MEPSITGNLVLQPASPQAGNTASVQLDPCSCLFFARAPPDASGEQLLALFSKYGTVEDINLYRRWPTAKQSKGCGTVQFTDHESAAAALQALNGIHKFPGLDTLLVVEWLDPARQTKPPKQSSGKDAPSAAKDQYRHVSHDGSTRVNAMDGSWSSPLPAGITDPYTLPALLAMMSLEMLNINAQAAAANASTNATIPQRRTWGGAYSGNSMSQPGDMLSWRMNNNPGYAARNRRSSCPNPGSFDPDISVPIERHSPCSYPTAAQPTLGASLTASQLLTLQQSLAMPSQQRQLQGVGAGMPVSAALNRAVATYGVSPVDGSYAAKADSNSAIASGLSRTQDYVLSQNVFNNFMVQTSQPTEGLYTLNSLDSDMFTPTAAGSIAGAECNWPIQQQQGDAHFAGGVVHCLDVNSNSGIVPTVPEQCHNMVCSAGRPDVAPPVGLPVASHNSMMWQQQPQQQSQEVGAEIVVRITPEILSAIGASLPHVATLSGANIQARAQAGAAGGLVLALTGTAAAREMASRLICAVVEQPLPAEQLSCTGSTPLAASYVM